MKKLTTILQLPIMDVLNGKKVGQAKDIIMNLDTKDIIYVLDDSVVASLFVIRGGEIQSIGKDVMLIKTSQSIQNSQDDPELGKELGDYYSVIGLDVITMEGNIAGTIVDISIDEKSKKIIDIELENGQKFAADTIISISDKYVFVQEGGDDEDEPEPIKQDVSEVNENEEEQTETEPEPEKDVSSYLIGMVLNEDVASEDGTFILEKGTVLTEELINDARENGVFGNLIMNAE